MNPTSQEAVLDSHGAVPPGPPFDRFKWKWQILWLLFRGIGILALYASWFPILIPEAVYALMFAFVLTIPLRKRCAAKLWMLYCFYTFFGHVGIPFVGSMFYDAFSAERTPLTIAYILLGMVNFLFAPISAGQHSEANENERQTPRTVMNVDSSMNNNPMNNSMMNGMMPYNNGTMNFGMGNNNGMMANGTNNPMGNNSMMNMNNGMMANGMMANWNNNGMNGQMMPQNMGQYQNPSAPSMYVQGQPMNDPPPAYPGTATTVVKPEF